MKEIEMSYQKISKEFKTRTSNIYYWLHIYSDIRKHKNRKLSKKKKMDEERNSKLKEINKKNKKAMTQNLSIFVIHHKFKIVLIEHIFLFFLLFLHLKK